MQPIALHCIQPASHPSRWHFLETAFVVSIERARRRSLDASSAIALRTKRSADLPSTSHR
jgi:hypothetical protein